MSLPSRSRSRLRWLFGVDHIYDSDDLMILSMRVRGTPQALAPRPAERPSASKNSSRSISPGCMGGSALVSPCRRSMTLS
jgi:hypothetical protein